MRFSLTLLLPACLAWCSSVEAVYDAPTTAEIAAASSDIVQLMKDQGSLQATIVRLGFHDCVGDACDGCINHENEGNAGLENVVAKLDEIYDASYTDAFSRADFWQLAAALAVKRGIQKSQNECTQDCMPDFDMPVYWGREDCGETSATDEVHELPEPTMTRSVMMTFFSDKYGLEEDDVVALLGAHSLGGANKNNSGYSGVWTVDAKNHFDNGFFKVLDNDDLSYVNKARAKSSDTDKKWQWHMFDLDGVDTTNRGFMLNGDIQLVWDIDVDAVEGTSCSIDERTCAEADTRGMVQDYRDDAEAFWDSYKRVYKIVSFHGYDEADMTEFELA